LVAATSSAPSAEPCALPVFCLFGAGQPMIVRSAMKLGRSVTAPSGAPRAAPARPRRTSSASSRPLHVPAVGLVARADVLGERDVGVVLDRDVVVVVDHDEVAELLVPASEEASELTPSSMSPSEAMHVDVVVERALALGGVRVEQAALAAGGHRHADGVADALAERAGGGLDAGGVAVLGVAGGLASPRCAAP
jgi:hypothetical protein